jgi:hypothetical protein
MIRYDLICDNGHAFDGWFRDSASFDRQSEAGVVSCAHCGSSKVRKQMMAPRISAKSNKAPSEPQRFHAGAGDPRAQMMFRMMKELRREVERTAENVGEAFPEEARKIHYGEAKKRGIYGVASADEAGALIEEGIEIHPLPRLPDDAN